MASFDASTAECFVFTYKEGMLSALAHDLKHRVTAFSVEIDDSTRAIEATFDASSLVVECVMKDGACVVGTLKDSHRAEIQRNVVKDILHAKKHPNIRFRSSRIEPEGEGYKIVGVLSLHGVDREIEAVARREDGRLIAEVELYQPDFGIKPYRAMMGTLKIKPALHVRLSLPA